MAASLNVSRKKFDASQEAPNASHVPVSVPTDLIMNSFYKKELILNEFKWSEN